MPFKVQCPHADCRKFMLLEDSARGTTVECLVCKKSMTLSPSNPGTAPGAPPQEPAPRPPMPVAGPTPKPQAPAPAAPSAAHAPPGAAAGAGGVVKCPCGAKVRMPAVTGPNQVVKCPKCGRTLS
jgi:hypothetical protein